MSRPMILDKAKFSVLKGIVWLSLFHTTGVRLKRTAVVFQCTLFLLMMVKAGVNLKCNNSVTVDTEGSWTLKGISSHDSIHGIKCSCCVVVSVL